MILLKKGQKLAQEIHFNLGKPKITTQNDGRLVVRIWITFSDSSSHLIIFLNSFFLSASAQILINFSWYNKSIGLRWCNWENIKRYCFSALHYLNCMIRFFKFQLTSIRCKKKHRLYVYEIIGQGIDEVIMWVFPKKIEKVCA